MATFDEMAPWEALRWFETPIERLVAGTGPGTQLCKVEPRRVLLIIAPAGSMASQPVTTDPSTPNQKGISLPTQGGGLVINIEWYGPLVQMAWYANILAGSNMTVFEVLLRDWPIPDKQWWENYLAPHAK